MFLMRPQQHPTATATHSLFVAVGRELVYIKRAAEIDD